MAEIMYREYEKATEVERRKEEEKWKQTLSYQEQLEKQLEEQVGLHLSQPLLLPIHTIPPFIITES